MTVVAAEVSKAEGTALELLGGQKERAYSEQWGWERNWTDCEQSVPLAVEVLPMGRGKMHIWPRCSSAADQSAKFVSSSLTLCP